MAGILKDKTDGMIRNAANEKKNTKKSGKKAKWPIVLFVVCAVVCGYAFLNPEGYENGKTEKRNSEASYY